MVATVFAPAGKEGAGLPTRYVGATSSGSPTYGAFEIGDLVVDRTGVMYICTAAGIPGTWKSAASLALPLTGGTVSGAVTFSALATLTGGTTTAGSAPVLTSLGATSGAAIQLTDTTRDYIGYLQVTTSGTATSLTMGHTSGASDVTIVTSGAVSAGTLWSFRLPAGWYFEWTGTTTAVGNQNAVGC